MDKERQAAIDALQARRMARGMNDPLNRLKAHINAMIVKGAEMAVNKPPKEKE
jgi:hypothetical protein